jgi:iron complex transport system substrate-binding protein
VQFAPPFALVALLAACRCEPPASTPHAPEPAAPALIDAAGRPVALAGPPARIVAVGRGVYMPLHLLAAFPGGLDALVGVEERGEVTRFVSDLDPAPDAWAGLAPEPGVEAIAALRPDLVLTKGTAVDPRAAALGRLGIPTLHLGMESPERFLDDVVLLGHALGQPARGIGLAGFYTERLERVRRLVEAVPEAERPRVLVAAPDPRSGALAVKVPAEGWMQTRQVALAGGVPVWTGAKLAGDGWTVVGFEQVAAWDPDAIVLCPGRGEDGAALVAGLRADPGWASLRAVQGGRLLAFPGDLYDWNSPDPRWILGLAWLAAALHPAQAGAFDVRAEVVDFYGALFGLAPERVEAWILPEVALGPP